MYFHESARIVEQHRDLEPVIERVDDLLYRIGATPIRCAVLADHLDIDEDLLGRILAVYESAHLVQRATLWYCGTCDVLIKQSDRLWCDICERGPPANDVHSEDVYLMVEPIVRLNMVTGITSVATEARVQFIAGDRGGAQRYQIQTPREYKAIGDALSRSEHRKWIQLASPIHAASADDIGSAYREKPTILHFAGHGEERSLFVIRDRDQLVYSEPLTAAQLVEILRNYTYRVKACVFSTCNSHDIARLVTEADVVDLAVGWRGKVTDDEAIRFATAFYEHIGNGLPFGRAFHLAKTTTTSKEAEVAIFNADGVNPLTSFVFVAQDPKSSISGNV